MTDDLLARHTAGRWWSWSLYPPLILTLTLRITHGATNCLTTMGPGSLRGVRPRGQLRRSSLGRLRSGLGGGSRKRRLLSAGPRGPSLGCDVPPGLPLARIQRAARLDSKLCSSRASGSTLDKSCHLACSFFIHKLESLVTSASAALSRD